MATKRSLKVLDRLAEEGRPAFTTAEVRSALKLLPQSTSNLLSRLAVEGLVDRVAGGRYVLRPPLARLAPKPCGVTWAQPLRPPSRAIHTGSAF
jgi:DNA-binding IclR family transcriptional regulator